MNIKEALKQELLSIPVNNKSQRELHILSENLDIDSSKLKFYLNELCNKEILKEKKQFICPNCHSSEILTEELLLELVEEADEEDLIYCEECCQSYTYEDNQSGHIYYDVVDYSALKAW